MEEFIGIIVVGALSIVIYTTVVPWLGYNQHIVEMCSSAL